MRLGTKVLTVFSVAAIACATAAPGAMAQALGGAVNMKSAQSRSAGKDISIRYQDGIEALQRNDFRGAEKAFGDVLEDSNGKKNSGANYLMAMAKINLDDKNGARKYLRYAVKYDEAFPEALGWLAIVENELGDAKASKKQIDALNKLNASCGGNCDKAPSIAAALAQIQQAFGDARAADRPPA
jgi:TolA-binding protein